MARKKIDNFFNVPTNEELNSLNSLSSALNLINEAGAIEEPEKEEPKKFIVKKKEELKELIELDFYERMDKELDEIADQADSAFEEIMDIAINAPSKQVGEIASTAQRFLETKLSVKTAKLEKKFKMLNMQLQQRKQQFIEDTKKAGAIPVEITDETPANPTNNGKILFNRDDFY